MSCFFWGDLKRVPCRQSPTKTKILLWILKDGENSSQNDIHPLATRIWGEVIWFLREFIVCWFGLACLCLLVPHWLRPSMQSKVPHEVLDKRAERQRTVRLSGRPVGPKLGFSMELPTSLKIGLFKGNVYLEKPLIFRGCVSYREGKIVVISLKTSLKSLWLQDCTDMSIPLVVINNLVTSFRSLKRVESWLSWGLSQQPTSAVHQNGSQQHFRLKQHFFLVWFLMNSRNQEFWGVEVLVGWFAFPLFRLRFSEVLQSQSPQNSLQQLLDRLTGGPTVRQERNQPGKTQTNKMEIHWDTHFFQWQLHMRSTEVTYFQLNKNSHSKIQRSKDHVPIHQNRRV